MNKISVSVLIFLMLMSIVQVTKVELTEALRLAGEAQTQVWVQE